MRRKVGKLLGFVNCSFSTSNTLLLCVLPGERVLHHLLVDDCIRFFLSCLHYYRSPASQTRSRAAQWEYDVGEVFVRVVFVFSRGR